MSRIGKKIIPIPAQTEVTLTDGSFAVKGPKGVLTRNFLPLISIEKTPEGIVLKPKEETVFSKMLWGTYSSHIQNMIKGVVTPYEKKLILEGVGFRAEVKGKDIVMQLGFSHPVSVAIPEGIAVVVEKSLITVSGIDKEQVGQFAARLRDKKKPEPYKGKGMRYEDEVVRRKEGKKTA
ncbi:MAG: 50S ribosomal protein L6 [bacterium]|nr:50S ribosomal protein L6 [bacterium]